MMRRAVLSSVVTVAALAAAAASVAAQPRGQAKVPRACGASAIPLSVGNEWTYDMAGVPAERQLSEAQTKALPPPPKKVVIKVTAIDTKDGVTTVSLSEDLDGRVHATSITCTNAGGFQIGPTSLWFNGEAGDVVGIEISDIVRTGKTLDLVGGKLTALADWHDDLTARWAHVAVGKVFPKLRKGTLSLSRHVATQPSEIVATKAGTWKAAKLGIKTTTVITIKPPTENPLRDVPLLVNFLYLADGVGVVQTLNSTAQYLLVDYKVQ
ncbi:MAG: hypothetical protein IPL61_00485 [Myxococcales bacterium]|nr:hypothetical protein [Myxococcales bacterium]